MAPPDALLESQPGQQAAQIFEINIRVRLTLKNPPPEFLVLVHRRQSIIEEAEAASCSTGTSLPPRKIGAAPAAGAYTEN